MKLSKKQSQTRRGATFAFTMIEIIGVVAIIAVLAALITPRVINAVARSKVNSTALSAASLKTATTDYFAKNNSFPSRAGTGATNGAVATGRFDADLISGGFLEKLFTCSIGSQLNDMSALTGRTHVRSQTAAASTTITITSTAGGDNFDLDGDGAVADFTTANTVVSVFIPGVSINDAIELNKIIDNTTNTSTSTSDTSGRCVYSTPSSGTVTVYLYVAHY